MKTSDEFDGLDAEALSKIRNSLHGLKAERSEQHQRWAWTRLEAVLNSGAPALQFPWTWREGVAWVVCGVAAVVGLVWFQLGDPAPIISSMGSNVSAVSFEGPSEDVIWVDGYDAMPGDGQQL
jgi:hypothetical protein